MTRRALTVVLAALVIVPALAQTPKVSPTTPQRAVATHAPDYFPERLDWVHKRPEEVGMNPSLVNEAVQLAIAGETTAPKNELLFQLNSFGKEPYNAIIGPSKDRGSASGLITRHGYIVAEWGDPKRVDMTHSVTKTFLTTVVGLAWQRGLIRDVNDYARDYMPFGVDLFEAPHNQTIKWDHLLRQTSDWQGTLWGKPDWADRPVGEKPEDWPNRKLWEPGTHFKYNDVRVNVMALAALQVWRRPLPEVLREEVMDPIGASSTWRWYGYDNSWVEVDGQKMQSVSGGGQLGRRHVHQLLRHGALRLSVPAQRQVEGPFDRVGEMDRDGPHPRIGQQDVRVRELVSQHRPQAAAERAGNGGPLRRQRIEHHLRRLGQRHRGGRAMDSRRSSAEQHDRQAD